MTPPAPHCEHSVRSCDSCNHAEKTNSEEYPYKCKASKPIPMMVHKFCVSWFGYVGCASHSDTRTLPQPQPVPDCSHCIHDKTKVRYEPTNGITFCVHRVSGKCVFAAAPQPPVTDASLETKEIKIPADRKWTVTVTDEDGFADIWEKGYTEGLVVMSITIRSQQGGSR